MSIYKRGNQWWIRITTPKGSRIRESTGTTDKKAAQEYHDRAKAELWRREKLKDSDKPRRKWQDAVKRFLAESKHKARHADDIRFLRWLDGHLYDRYMDEINRDLLDRVAEECKRKNAAEVSNATVNRHMEVVRTILNRAHRQWGWIDRVPHVRMLPEMKRRIRWLTRDEAGRLLAELPEHLEAMARFSLATGLRESNVVGLEWTQVNLETRNAWIHADQAKARKPIPVPLNDEAVIVLRQQVGKNTRSVFTYKGEPVTKANNHAWRKALVRAGIENFRWHDLRHTWASWHVQAGTPIHVLQTLGGWSDVRMVQRYAHLSSDHLAPYAQAISPGLRLVSDGTKEG